MKSCPSRAYTEAIGMMNAVFKAYRWLQDKSIFPISGGLCDQSSYFIHCVDFMNSYQAMTEHKKIENAEKMKKIFSKKTKKLNKGK